MSNKNPFKERVLSEEEAKHYKLALSHPVSTVKAEKLPTRDKKEKE